MNECHDAHAVNPGPGWKSIGILSVIELGFLA